MSDSHAHAIPATTNTRALRLALALTAGFMLVEVVGGVLAGSLALISDAAHMLTDVMALAIALVAIHIGRRRSDARRTFGYQRLEILAAAFNAAMLFVVAAYILYEAYRRLRTPSEVHSTAMLIIAAVGLVVNVISMRLLNAGKDGSLNVKGAYLEVWSDLLGSIGVIVGALTIRLTGRAWVDSIIAVAIGLWVLPRTWLLLKESLNVLLEGVPQGMDPQAVERTIRAVPGVRGLHDLHVWSITTGKTSLTAHLSVDPRADCGALIGLVSTRLEEAHHIEHVTLQCEAGPCPNASGGFHGDAPLAPVPDANRTA
jgi:cobalt-zinc-cadmium efflux system protein